VAAGSARTAVAGPKEVPGAADATGPKVMPGAAAVTGPKAMPGAADATGPKEVPGAAANPRRTPCMAGPKEVPGAATDPTNTSPAVEASRKRLTSTSACQGEPTAQWHRGRLRRRSFRRHRKTSHALTRSSNSGQHVFRIAVTAHLKHSDLQPGMPGQASACPWKCPEEPTAQQSCG